MEQNIKISAYDQRELNNLSVNAIDELQRYGDSHGSVENALQAAFRMGFTAVSRGESEQPHPPAPDYLTGLQTVESAPKIQSLVARITELIFDFARTTLARRRHVGPRCEQLVKERIEGYLQAVLPVLLSEAKRDVAATDENLTVVDSATFAKLRSLIEQPLPPTEQLRVTLNTKAPWEL